MKLEKTAARKAKAGSITLALGLIALGGGLLAANLGFTQVVAVLKLWPVLLIGLGLEYFIRKLFAREEEVRFSIPSTILAGFIAVSAWAASALYGVIPHEIINEGILGDRTGYVRQWQGEPVAIAGGARLEIENRMGDVEISQSPDNKMHISARIEGRGPTEEKAKAAAESAKINVESGQVTRVFTDPPQGPTGSGVTVRLQVAVPDGLKISTVNKLGNISAEELSAESVELETNAGRIEVEDYTGALKASSKLGELELNGIKGDIEAEASMGRISLKNPQGNVTATTRNGSIELDSDKPLDKKYVLRGENGEITFRLPRGSNLKINASTVHGGISGLETDRNGPGDNKGEITLGAGTGSALLETRNGRVNVDIY